MIRAPFAAMPVDIHVHAVGLGAGGTGCWLRTKRWQRRGVEWMTRHLGMPSSALAGDFDRLYAERLLEMVRGSSLGAAVILAQDLVYDEQGRAREELGTFYTPNDYVLKLAREHAQFLPGVSIHPGRPDALEELERCLAGGAALMKCLPCCHLIDCRDRRYTRFWERMAEAGLPLLAHTGGEHTVRVNRAEWSDPRVLEGPLECGVTVIAAHCGTKSSLFDQDYFDAFVEMTRRFPRLYGDISALLAPIRGRRVRRCLSEPLVDRMVHGSDYPVPVLGHYPWAKGWLNWSTFRQWQKHPNILERDYQFKRAAGFPDAVFTRAWGLLRKTRITLERNEKILPQENSKKRDWKEESHE